MNVEKEKDKRTNGEVGRPKPPFKPLPLVEQVKRNERDTLAAATQATVKNDDPILRPPALEKAVLYARSRYADLWHRTGTRDRMEIDGDRRTSSEFRMM